MKTSTLFKRAIPVVTFNILVIMLLLAGAEILFRIYIARRTIFERQPFFQYDSMLGWVPRPGTYFSSWGELSIDSSGFREGRSAQSITSEKIILACGDSFTFGSGVSDQETWPHYLSTELGCEVVNAGVSGYGLDQTVLRLSKVIDKVMPDLVIVSMIWDDIGRCGLSKRQRFKPYFDLVDGRLNRFNNPVPPPGTIPDTCPWHEQSLIIQRFKRTLRGHLEPNCIRVHRRGLELAPHLIDYALKEVRKNGARVMILIQPSLEDGWPGQVEKCKELEKRLQNTGVPILNLVTRLKNDFNDRDGEQELLFDEHMTPSGNRWLAEEIASFIYKRNLF